MSPFFRKTLGCLASVVVGIIAGELFFVTVAMVMGGFQAIAAVPVVGLWPLAALFAALAVAPWPMIGTREGYGPVWFSSLIVSAGFGIIVGFMAAVIHHEMAFLELNMLLHTGFAFCAGFFACLTVHLSAVFKQPEAAA